MQCAWRFCVSVILCKSDGLWSRAVATIRKSYFRRGGPDYRRFPSCHFDHEGSSRSRCSIPHPGKSPKDSRNSAKEEGARFRDESGRRFSKVRVVGPSLARYREAP